MNYYNEIDKYCAQWLRNLMLDGHIPIGIVDERSIVDVTAKDLEGFTQCHFFAGLGEWAHALRLAGWPDDRPVWTGSCPCQPFSVAGAQAGFDDPRHLWPQFRRLIEKRRPSVVFGEQVAGASDWLRLVRSDLETMDYAVGAIPMEAASADADHFRDRYWFVADLDSGRRTKRNRFIPTVGHRRAAAPEGSNGSQLCHVAHCDSGEPRTGLRDYGEVRGLQKAQCQPEQCATVPGGSREGGRDRTLANGSSQRPQVPISEPGHARPKCPPPARSGVRPMVDDPGVGWGEGWTESEFRSRGFTAAVASFDGRQYIECPNGKWRRLPPPRVRWLGNGIPSRVAKLRAFGNAIDPRPASQFIGAYLDTLFI